LKSRVGRSRRPHAIGHNVIQLREIGLFDRIAPIGEPDHSVHVVAQPFHVVPDSEARKQTVIVTDGRVGEYAPTVRFTWP